jgi:hypothetical protein
LLKPPPRSGPLPPPVGGWEGNRGAGGGQRVEIQSGIYGVLRISATNAMFTVGSSDVLISVDPLGGAEEEWRFRGRKCSIKGSKKGQDAKQE